MKWVKNTGVIAHEIQKGAYNGDLFIDFIRRKLMPHFNENLHDILIMDNCRFHDVLRLLDSSAIRYKFLPPYSPQLKPIEEYFSFVKSHYKSMRPLSRNSNDVAEKINHIVGYEDATFDGWF